MVMVVFFVVQIPYLSKKVTFGVEINLSLSSLLSPSFPLFFFFFFFFKYLGRTPEGAPRREVTSIVAVEPLSSYNQTKIAGWKVYYFIHFFLL